MATRRDGRSDASERIDSCGDDGCGGSVYAVPRCFSCWTFPGSYALLVISWIGGVTALLAALIALQQSDIKRILAYSTLSQLGYMVLAVGVGAAGPAMFHLTTHAFFKALLFLGAGAIIHVLHHQQDIWKMGGFSGACRSRSSRSCSARLPCAVCRH
jgi:NADH:ubiquinone oxidoreductase subunit 5 (subunit L)/multisubunit Na+/H+ antiporter MnhA subunit